MSAFEDWWKRRQAAKRREEPPDDEPDMINSPPHYTQGDIESIDYIEDQGHGRGFCYGNALKYLARAPHKGCERADLLKAIWYIERLLDGDLDGETMINQEEKAWQQRHHDKARENPREALEHAARLLRAVYAFKDPPRAICAVVAIVEGSCAWFDDHDDGG